MALHHQVRVPVPSKTYRRKQNNSVYVYYYLEFFRKNGKASNTSVNIGKIDDESGMLIPNDHYYEHFDHAKDQSLTPEVIVEYEYFFGYPLVLHSIVSELGLDDILHKSFGSRSSRIMTVAGYAIRKGSVMSYIDNYTEHYYDIFGTGRITDQRVSELFQELTRGKQRRFFVQWVNKCAANQCIVYDVTSISTYSDSIVQAEYGYNRDNEDLKQLNIGLFSGEESKLPVYFERYNGSITDKVNMVPVMKNASDVGINNVHIVMDGGFFDPQRLEKLFNAGITFTVGMPSTLDAAKRLLDLHRNEIHTVENRTRFRSNYAKLYDATIGSIKGRVLIGLNVQTQDHMMETLKSDIEKRGAELREKAVKKYSTVMRKRRYTDLFEITEDPDEGYKYSLKEGKIQESANNYGYFLVFTTDMQSSAEDILYYYREKDVDEKLFYELKDYMGFDRTGTQNEDTTSGKIFTLFVALIIRSYMQMKLGTYMDINNLTLERCMEVLEDVRIIKFEGQKPRLLKAITKRQRELLEIFGIDIQAELDSVE